MIDLGEGNSISGYGQINVVLGKNGSGKSTLLRLMDTKLAEAGACIKYITPERGGELVFDGGLETQRVQSAAWLSKQRRKNQYNNFRQSSVSEFRILETLVLRSIEADRVIRDSDFCFDSEIDQINEVLDRIMLCRSDTAGFEIVRKSDGGKASSGEISSGEAELICLAVEILYFRHVSKQKKFSEHENWLLLDEPDVHLHPDLQHRLMKLLVSSMNEANGRVILATHSTTILSSLCSSGEDIRVGLKQFDENAVCFQEVSGPIQDILPMFGAHPLSNVFNERPPLFVEGEDDERVWQAAVRRSEGKIRVYPCVTGNIQSLNEYESAANNLMCGVYDDAKAFSVRDKDDDPYEIDDIGAVIRCRLNCRSVENLILTDDVLNDLGTDWETLKNGLDNWIGSNAGHSRQDNAVAFRDSGWNRKEFPLKNLRNVIVGITGSQKPWEVAVGQAIARLGERRFSGESSLEHFLGEKLVQTLRLSEPC